MYEFFTAPGAFFGGDLPAIGNIVNCKNPIMFSAFI